MQVTTVMKISNSFIPNTKIVSTLDFDFVLTLLLISIFGNVGVIGDSTAIFEYLFT